MFTKMFTENNNNYNYAFTQRSYYKIFKSTLHKKANKPKQRSKVLKIQKYKLA